MREAMTGPRVMFLLWMGTVLLGFAAMAAVLVSGR